MSYGKIYTYTLSWNWVQESPKNLLLLSSWNVENFFFFTEKYAKQVIQYNISPGWNWKEMQEFLLNSR